MVRKRRTWKDLAEDDLFSFSLREKGFLLDIPIFADAADAAVQLG